MGNKLGSWFGHSQVVAETSNAILKSIMDFGLIVAVAVVAVIKEDGEEREIRGGDSKRGPFQMSFKERE